MHTQFAARLSAFTLLAMSFAAAYAGTAGDLSDDRGWVGVFQVLGAALLMISAITLLWYFARKRRKSSRTR